MSEYFLEPTSFRKVNVELDLSNYESGINTWSSGKKVDLANLKSNVDNLDIAKLKNVPTNLRNLKSKVDKLDVDKLYVIKFLSIKVN